MSILENFVVKQFCRLFGVWSFAMAAVLISSIPPAIANTLIRGEFEYDVDQGELSEWQIGPAFSFGDLEEVELEIPFGQNDGEWFTEPELTYEVEFDDFSLGLSVGAEILFSGEPIEPFGMIEGSLEF